MTSRRALLVWSSLFVLLSAGVAGAHKERQIVSPIRPGPTPDLNRTNPHTLVVCKPSSKPTKAEHADIHQRLQTATGDALAQAQAEEVAWHRNSKLFKRCRYEHIQAAATAAVDNTTIYVLPGVYREEPSRAAPTSPSGDNPDGSFSYLWHVHHPNDANLIAILGKTNITLEGTGVHPRDVVIDAGFTKDVPIRCDKCKGFIVRNLQAKDGNEHCIYVVDSDGYVFDRTVGSYCKDYELFSFASDNGLYTDCEAEGGGDSGVYIGGHPDTSSLGRFSAILQRTDMHHNALGFSGTQGTSVQITDCDVHDNAIGISFDSEFDHPNFPQRNAVIENNRIYSNNYDIYAPTTDVPAGGPAYNFFRYPVGTGIWIIGGDNNVIRNNYFYDNEAFAVLLAGNPLEIDPNGMLPPPGVNNNQIYGNHVGIDPQGVPHPNAYFAVPPGTYAPGVTDFWWDETGNNNCWGAQAADSQPFTTDPPNADHAGGLPGACPFPNTGAATGDLTLTKGGLLLSCTLVPDPANPPRYKTADFFYPCPFGQTDNAPYQNKDQAECGNGQVDLGEDCDAGGGYGGGMLANSCDELGQGSGTLACTNACLYDTSACGAQTCGRYGGATLRLGKLGSPAGDDQFDLVLNDIAGSGRTFDPTTEEVSLVIRTDPALPATGTVIYSRTIPAGSSWTTAGTTATFTDAPGANALRLSIIGQGTLVNPPLFKATAHLGGGALAGLVGARTGTVILRIGDDCWRGELPCTFTRTGNSGTCRKAKKP